MNARGLTLSLLATTLAALAFTAAPALAALETPEKEAVSGVTATTAQVSGVLNPNATAAVEGGFYGFLYGVVSEPAVCGAERIVPEPFGEAGIAAGLPKEEVSFELTGLQPHAKYTVCLLEVNAAQEQVMGVPVLFETEAAPPTIVEPPVTGVAPTEARLEGLVNPNNQSTECHVQYGTEASLMTSTTVGCAPETLEGYGDQGSLVLSGLTQATTYYYRVVAKNASGEVESAAIEHFTTGTPEPPEASKVVPVTAITATLKGVLNPKHTGEGGTYEFVYRKSASECQGGEPGEERKAPEPAGPANGVQGEAEEAPVGGLEPGTTYTFCLLAKNTAEEPAISTPVTFTTLAVAPAVTGEFTSGVEATVATLNASIDPGGASTTYHFEYLTEAQFQANGETFTGASTTPESLPVGADNTEHPAEATLEDLQSGMTYHYRAVATNTQSPAGGTPGPDATFTTPAGSSTTAETCPNAQARTEQPYGQALPDCRAYELVSPLDKNDRGAEAVDSRASVSGGAVAYVSRGSFSEAGQPAPQGAVEVSRYLARRGAGGWSTQNITPPSIAYGAGRVAFAELLFTPDLSTGLLFSEHVSLVQDGELAGYDNLYVADLASNPASYQTVTNVKPPGAQPYEQGNNFDASVPKAVGVSTDLSHVVFQQGGNLTANAEGNGEHVYEWTGGKLSLVDVPPAGTRFEYQDTAGAPGDFQLIEDGDTWHAVSANGLRVFFTAGEAGRYHPSEGQLYVRENPEQPQSLEENGECTEPAKACTVEVSKSQKTNGTGPGKTDPNGPQPAYFRDANAAGTRVFFTSRAELTNDANTDEDKAANLYEYDFEKPEGERLTDLTVPTKAEGPEDPDGAAVLGLVTAGENAGEENSYVYFVANGVLASNENANKEKAQLGHCRKEGQEELVGEPTCNLYVAHYEGGKWETKFIAMLTSGHGGSFGQYITGDEMDWLGYEGGTLGYDTGPGQHTVRVTPYGTTLAFESERGLTGYDNEPVEPGAGAPGHKCTELGGLLKTTGALDPAVPCREVYLYDAVTGKLVCASCDPSGARPVGPAELGGTEFEEGDGLLAPSVYYLPRNLSEAGGRLFFQSPDALVSHDSNNQLDVYEWEQPASPAEAAKGENSCTSSSPAFSASDGGCVFPVSDVAGDFESHFMDASPSGSDVFLATKDQLVPVADADSRANVYDVRVGGGFPVTVSPPVCDNGDSCKAPVSPQPGVFGAPASATFSGPGNPAPAVVSPPPKKTTAKIVKCKRGFVKSKKHRCVKKPKKKSKRAKRAGNDRGAK